MADSEFLHDVDEATFEEAVIEASSEKLIVVDFWAPWCGPCRMLGPTLERLVEAAHGSWTLAKVNVDHNQSVAMRYGVQGIPAVKAFRDGEVVDEFVGAQPEPQVRRWLDALLQPERTAADQIIAQTRFQERAGVSADETELRRKVSADPSNLSARLELAAVLVERGEHRDALEGLLMVLGHADAAAAEELKDKARQDMLAIFDLLGEEHEITKEYRPRMATALW